ncbi:nitroreductase [Mesoterricola sediminis]|uniref:Nitroreductase n=1 Tax=Mesoterricola sediminis TaxID=2927980 RepID=A0AA48KCT5_9BACT|nr:nitroreductase [Mesoterricola sediminis]BDU76385.1 nitroreductase [Mesoterricola sediminis]
MDTPLQAALDQIMSSRYSCRAFLDTPVPRAEVEAILAAASRAPSGTNTQPWRVHVLTGARLKRLSERILAVVRDPEAAAAHQEPYAYYPTTWVSPYLERRRKVGFDLYALLGIPKGDTARMQAQFERNYGFFGAPVGLIFTLDGVMAQGSYLDYGMFLQNVMLAAKARGLDTCPQAAFIRWHRVIAEELDLPAGHGVVCGMSLGHADPAAPENRLRTERAPLADWVTFLE